MIEKTPIVSQVGRIAKCAPLWAAHPISQMCQCRGAASSLGRSSLQVFLATGKPSAPKSVALAQIQPSSCRVRRLGGRQLNTFQVLPEQQGVKPYDQ